MSLPANNSKNCSAREHYCELIGFRQRAARRCDLEPNMNFVFSDWLLLAFYLAGMVLIGIFFSRRQTSTGEFFLGGRRFTSLAVSLSVLGTSLSAITFLGVPGFVVQRDWSTLFASLMGFPAALIVAWLFVPFFYNLGLTSTYDYLQRRFDTRVAALGGVLFLLLRGVLAGVAIYAPSLALCAVTGWNLTLCIVVSGLMTIVYTALGGISAVIWTEIVQVVVLFVGAILVLFQLAQQLPGSATDWVAQAAAARKFNLFDFRLSAVELTFWGSVIGGLFYSIAFYGVDQVMVQRYLASSSLRQARKSLCLQAAYLVPSILVFFVMGTMLYLFVEQNRSLFPETLTGDQILPYYIVRFLPAGLPGLLVAAIYAAAMSTLSGVLNSLATISVNDFYKRFWNPNETEGHYVRMSRRLTMAWGTLAILTALGVGHIDPSVWMQSIKAGGLLMGPMLGMFLLGMLTERSTPAAAFWGCLIGVAASLAAGWTSSLQLFWLTLFGTSLTLIAGGVICLLWPASEAQQTANRSLTLRFLKAHTGESTRQEAERTV